jgi:head-tail adaptor
MQAGRRRHWLICETLVEEQDSDGNLEPEWLPAFDTSPLMPFEVIDLSGRELLAAQTINSKVSTRMRTAYRPGFDAVMRLRNPVTGEIFNIEAVISDPNSRIRWVTLQCSKGVNAGGTAS